MSAGDLNIVIGGVSFRSAIDGDAADMAACRLTDTVAGPADPRMAAYFQGKHHLQCALTPRTGYLALADGAVVGYIAGHLTTRHGCGGEVQYLFVAPGFRRRGIATALLRLLGCWFQEHSCAKVCVCLDADSPAALPFYASRGASPLSPIRPLWYVRETVDSPLGDSAGTNWV